MVEGRGDFVGRIINYPQHNGMWPEQAVEFETCFFLLQGRILFWQTTENCGPNFLQHFAKNLPYCLQIANNNVLDTIVFNKQAKYK